MSSGVVACVLSALTGCDYVAKLEVLQTRNFPRKRVGKKGKKLLVGDGVIGEPIDTGDGLIYPIDTFLR